MIVLPVYPTVSQAAAKISSHAKKCKYKMTDVNICEANTIYKHDYCVKHRHIKCYCGSQATHTCAETYKCEEPLCDNMYCSSSHNLKAGHVKRV